MRVIQKLTGEVNVMCPHCRAFLGVVYEDVVIEEAGVLHRHPGKDCYANCCECGWTIPLSTKDLPLHWVRNLK
jgi:hypothetical protein